MAPARGKKIKEGQTKAGKKKEKERTVRNGTENTINLPIWNKKTRLSER